MAAAAKYAKAHAAAITSFVVSTAVFMGCEAVTTGIGTIGCAALSGAAGALVTQGFKCADSGGDEIGSAEARSAISSADGGGGGGSGGGGGEPGAPEAGAEDGAGETCPAAHSFTGSTRVLMADGTTKPIDQVKAGDKIADAVPGQKGTRARKVSKAIVTRTDHDFVDVTVAPVKAGAGTAVKKTARRAAWHRIASALKSS